MAYTVGSDNLVKKNPIGYLGENSQQPYSGATQQRNRFPAINRQQPYDAIKAAISQRPEMQSYLPQQPKTTLTPEQLVKDPNITRQPKPTNRINTAYLPYEKPIDNTAGRLGQQPAGGLRILPDSWIINKMPGPGGPANNSYLIVNGERREIGEFDMDWIAQQGIKPRMVY